jgi:ribonuclease P protein component
MLAKKARLTSSEVEEVLKQGRSFSIPPKNGGKSLILLKFLAKNGGFKAAAIAPKSVAKGAVERNRLRRALYRALAGFPTPKTSGCAVFFVRAIPKGLLTPAFAEEIGPLLQKIT